MIVQAVSRTTWANLTKLRWASCQAKRTINQCCSSTGCVHVSLDGDNKHAGKAHDQPMLQQHADQFGIQFTQDPPWVARAPFIHLPMLLPEFVEQFNGTITNDKFCL